MTEDKNSSNPENLASRMRREWDRRVSHDYRYWMSDGVQSDEEMWAVGERDFSLLLKEYPRSAAANQVALELGCGVGRLLRAASKVFGQVIGVDVSEAAITQARRLLDDCRNVRLQLGDGLTLQTIANESIDFAFSFAALSSMPTSVAASYLLELSRILKPGAVLRVQVYLGNELSNCESDTISIRSFDRLRFEQAVARCGFEVNSVEELILPFEVSDPEVGMIASLVSLTRMRPSNASTDEVEKLLISRKEEPTTNLWNGSVTEYLLALARARQHIEAKNFSEAEKCLRYAQESVRTTDEIYHEILIQLQQARLSVTNISDHYDVSSQVLSSGSIWERNNRVLEVRFPEVARMLSQVSAQERSTVRLDTAVNGMPICLVEQMPLDNRHDPRGSAEQFVQRALNERRGEAEGVLVHGFAGGYHLEVLTSLYDAPIGVYEPSPSVLRTILESRDLTGVLNRIQALECRADALRLQWTQRGLSENVWTLVHPQTRALHRSACDEMARVMRSERAFRELRPSIAVVGPIYGGSLPIAGYVTNALTALHQRVRYLDFSQFYPAYKKIEEYLKTPQRMDRIQSDYVEMISSLVLEAVAENPVDIVLCLAQAPLSARALTELRNRGVITAMWFVEDCRRFQTWREISKYYDYMFLIQKDEFPALVEQAGAGKALYLPVGCDPNVHKPVAITTEEKKRWGSEVSFVGAGYNNRQQMFASLAHLDFKIWGTEWPGAIPFDRLVQEDGRRIDPKEYVKIFSATDINLNLHSSSERDGVEPDGDFVNPRTFELAASGAFQLVDQRRYLPECFEPGNEVVTFQNLRDLEEKIQYYSAHPDERQNIASRARTRALSEHTYEKRIEQMMRYIYADRYEQLQSRTQELGWQRVFDRAKKHPELRQRLQAAFERGDPPNLESLYNGIATGKGKLTPTEERILFIHHVRHLVTYVQRMRDGQA